MNNIPTLTMICNLASCGMPLAKVFDLAHYGPQLLELKLEGYHGQISDMPAFVKLMQQHPTLQRLVFQQCTLEEQCSSKLIEAISQRPRLTSLVFNQVPLQTAEIKQGLNYLAASSLNALTLNQVRLTDEGLVAMAGWLYNNRSLQQLSLQGNKFTIIGIRALADALKHNKHLLTLDLSRNHLTADCTEALAKALATNRMLEVLNLDHNQISDKGAEAIAKLLLQNSFIEDISLSHNQIDYEKLALFNKALQDNKSLQKLYVAEDNYPCEDFGLAGLDELVIDNEYLAENRCENYLRLVIYLACALPTSAFGRLPQDILLYLIQFVYMGTTGKLSSQLFNCASFIFHNSEGIKHRIKLDLFPLVKETTLGDISQFSFFKPLNTVITGTTQEKEALKREAQLDGFIHSLSKLRGRQTPTGRKILWQEIERFNQMFNKNYSIYRIDQDDIQVIIDDLARMKQKPERNVHPKISL